MNKLKDKKKLLFLLIILLIIILFGIFLIIYLPKNKEKFSLNNNNESKNILLDEYYTVTFETDGGNSINSVVIKKDDLLEMPQDPTKEGYTFIEWQLENKKYDFNTPITKDITLKAIWKENENSSNESNNNTSVNNGTIKPNNSNNINTTSKINLNNNISVTDYYISSGTLDCFYYMFVNNLQEVFPNANITKISNNPYEVNFWHNLDRTDTEVSTEEINTYLSNGSLKINTTEEVKLKNTLNKYKNGKYKGIANVTYEEQNHRFSLSYNYLSFNGLNVNSMGEMANKEINNILSNATLFKGTCGSFNNYQNLTLTEDLCNKYNLTCDRW